MRVRVIIGNSYREYVSLREAIKKGALKPKTKASDASYFISNDGVRKYFSQYDIRINWRNDIAVFV